MINASCWEKGNVHNIRIEGSGSFVREMVGTLVRDFNEPKFGYNGELYDEYHE